MARLHVAILLLVAVIGSIQCCDTEAQVVEEVQPAADLKCGFSCCGKPNGNYPYPGNCHLFWNCSCGRATLYQCPCGTHYSVCARRCVCHDEKVECEDNEKTAHPKLQDILKV